MMHPAWLPSLVQKYNIPVTTKHSKVLPSLKW